MAGRTLPRLSDISPMGVTEKTFNPMASHRQTEEWAKRLVEDLDKRLRVIEMLLQHISLPVGGYINMEEFSGATDISAPSDNQATLYVRDNGAGKEQLVVRFNTGVVQIIATEP